MRRMLVISFFLMFGFSAFCQITQTDRSLVAYFPFNGSLSDESSSKLNALAFNVALTTDVTGKTNSAYYFNGVNAYIEVKNKPSINLTDAFTISCWIAPESRFNFESWISKSVPNSQWRFGYGDIRLKDWGFGNWNGDRADYLTAADSIPLKQWSFVTATYSKATKMITLYLNGKQVDAFEVAYDFVGSELPLFIGYQTDDVCWFNGNIDEVKLFNRALSAIEIGNLYQEFAGKITKPIFINKSETYTSQNGMKNLFHQLEPSIVPLRFAPDLFCTRRAENSSPTFSPDLNEVYWSATRRSRDTIYQEILFTKKVGDKWTDPQRAAFSSGKLYEGGPVLSADGNKLYTYRGQPIFRWGRVPRSCQIISYTKNNNEWTNPQVLADGIYPTVTKEGTLYYNSLDLNTLRIRFKDGKYSQPETITNIAFPVGRNYQSFIAPDESYLIFTNAYTNGDNGDFYITFRDKQKDSWTSPILIDAIKTFYAEYFPSLSPDGKYFYFVSLNFETGQDIYWIKSSFIEDIRKKQLSKK
ncbi:MAG: hypothetical protein HOO91_13940 [Bacteroidales bacterium]|nr:hypothetical protein [Bacteroidales bacterium]